MASIPDLPGVNPNCNGTVPVITEAIEVQCTSHCCAGEPRHPGSLPPRGSEVSRSTLLGAALCGFPVPSGPGDADSVLGCATVIGTQRGVPPAHGSAQHLVPFSTSERPEHSGTVVSRFTGLGVQTT